MCAGVFVVLTVCMKQCSLSSWAYNTPSLMKTDIALKMNDTKRFMWMKFLVQCSFLCRKTQEPDDSCEDIFYSVSVIEKIYFKFVSSFMSGCNIL